MPGRDGTGPLGQGAMTGRGLGVCTGANVGLGAGYGRGFGLGNRCRRNFVGYFSRPAYGLSDKEVLAEEKNILQRRLDVISKQLDNLSDSEK